MVGILESIHIKTSIDHEHVFDVDLLIVHIVENGCSIGKESVVRYILI